MTHIGNQDLNRRSFLSIASGALLALYSDSIFSRAFGASLPTFQVILGRPSLSAIAVNLIATEDSTIYIEYGISKTTFSTKSSSKSALQGEPVVFELSGLKSNSKYYYRIRYQVENSNSSGYQFSATSTFVTAKTSGKSFTFSLQGDTHPERLGKMYNPDLYKVMLNNVASQSPDFHILLGDDFSIDPLIQKGAATLQSVDKVYKSHRDFLSILGSLSSIFLVNGNHEQAASYLLNGTPDSPAIYAGKARNKYFALPEDGKFYSADKTLIPDLGLARDYYSWNWGDALFITLDPYWHSSVAVDNVAGVSKDEDAAGKAAGGGKNKELWKIGLGDDQYFWLKNLLEKSSSKYIFVFAHHVMGTGRGGVEVSYDYEWGGADPQKKTTFKTERPNWDLPIHDLFVKHKVSAFFQGHDHIFVTQERDKVIYQSVGNPADDTFSMFNETAYKTGVKSPNTGHLRVSVTATKATVDYFLAARSTDTKRKNLDKAHSYTILPRKK